MTKTIATANASPSPNVSDALSAWQSSFLRDVTAIKHLLTLHTNPDNTALRDGIEPHLSSLSKRLSTVEQATQRVSTQLDGLRPLLQSVQQADGLVVADLEKLCDIRDSLPDHLRGVVQQYIDDDTKKRGAKLAKRLTATSAVVLPTGSSDSLSPSESIDGEEDATTVQKGGISRHANDNKPRQTTGMEGGNHPSSKKPPPLPHGTTSRPMSKKRDGASTTPPATSATPKSGAAKSRKADILVRSPTAQELAAAPQYVKGRITLEALQGVAARLGEIASLKYALIRRPNAALSSQELTQCQEFRDAECDETQGRLFLTDGEIKSFGKYRIDSTTKTAINVLRHVGSLKEVRGKNRARVFIINDIE